jgi:hypothetical protein
LEGARTNRYVKAMGSARGGCSPKGCRNGTRDVGASFSTLECLRGDSWGDIIGLVFGFRLERQEPPKLSFDLRAVGTRLTEQREHLIVVVSGGSFTEASTANGVGSVDPRVDRQAGRCDVPASEHLARCGIRELVGFARIRPNLCTRYRLGSGRSRH